MKSAAPVAPSPRKSSLLLRLFEHPLGREFVALILLVLAFVVGAKLSPYFLDVRNLLDSTSDYIEVGLIALAMTFIIVAGHIDLSVASTMGLVATVTGVLFAQKGMPFGGALGCGVLLGAGLGFVNGVLITRLKLPSLTVTLGTYALYRGLAQVMLGDQSAGGFPEWFNNIDMRYVAGSPVPLPLVIFLVAAVVFGLVLHRTVLGRWTYAIGTNETASRYAGIAVDRITLLLFTVSGFVAGLAGLMMASRLQTARYDLGLGKELDVITAVVLGGTSIFGGRGTILGSVIALFLIGILQTGMGLANISENNQQVAIGLLLIFSVVLPNLVQKRRF
jgi:rhamnose transport system permease protein